MINIIAILLPLTALIWRLIYRGYHYAGWEISSSARGYFLIHHIGFYEAFKKCFLMTRDCQYCGQDGILKVFIPGALNFIYPWQYWGQISAFFLFVFSFWLVGITFQLKENEWALLALAIGSSATLIATSISGASTAILSHSLALFIIFHPFFRKHWFSALLIGLLTIEVSWHSYGIGKTIFIPFILAAIFQGNVSIKNRVVNLVLGLCSILLIYLSNIGDAASKLSRFDNLIPLTFDNFYQILTSIFIDPGMDLIIIPAIGLLCLVFLRKNKLLFAGLLLSQLFLVLTLGFHGISHLKPRRFILVDFYCVVVILAVFKQWLQDSNLKVMKKLKF